jgi:hypothetical protein
MFVPVRLIERGIWFRGIAQLSPHNSVDTIASGLVPRKNGTQNKNNETEQRLQSTDTDCLASQALGPHVMRQSFVLVGLQNCVFMSHVNTASTSARWLSLDLR